MGSSFQIRGKLAPRVDLAIGAAGLFTLAVVWCWLTYGGYREADGTWRPFVLPLFLPSPTGIWEGMTTLHERGWLFPAIGRSFWRVTQSLALVVLIGVPVGVLMGAFPAVDAFLRKLVNGGKSVPTTGLVGLIVLWFSIEERAKIVFLVLGAIFYMVILVRSAVRSVGEEYLRVAKDLGASPWQTICRVLLPGALPGIWDGVAVCNGIMWTYIVLAEYINVSPDNMGLGGLLSVSSRANESGQVFGMLIVIGLISSTTDWAMQTVRKRYLDW